jgi:putative transposase
LNVVVDQSYQDLIDFLLADYKMPEDVMGEIGLLKQLTKLLVKLALDADKSEQFGLDKNAPVTNPLGGV